MSHHIDENAKDVLLFEAIHPVGKQAFEEVSLNVDLLDHSLVGDELNAKIKHNQVVGVRSKTKITSEVLSANPHLTAIGCFCIGTNQVALEKANELGIPVFNAPYSNTRSVAELVISEMISLSRQIAHKSGLAHQGVWEKTAAGSNEVRGKVLGIVGYGHIGSQVSILAESLGLKVVFYDTIKKLPLGNASSSATLDKLLEKSDFVTLHVPETMETKDMMGKKQFGKMKRGAHLLNLSRGTVVVIDDLVEALKSGQLAGAAVDVFPVEPKSNKDQFDSPLQGVNNVILTPHIGGSTQEAQEAIGHEVSESLIKYIQRGATTGAVNFPQLEIPPLRTGARLLNVHENKPGVLGDINTLISNAGINISAQFLSTDSKIGYLVVDFEDVTKAKELAIEVAKKDVSIKTRVILGHA
ncbi:MAG: phosphoglycerate dehydrogenase [Bdellovibrionaceae bacterium]|jgi:D-3-phosphoglycerate dehydrogenase / 2-oxoglutarate reductase|nr:phosphoglycerate dehydrogenase [Pseudobdellovibrionaceae bacterium]